MKKRVLSILLCLCMALTLLPTAALAEETPAPAETPEVPAVEAPATAEAPTALAAYDGWGANASYQKGDKITIDGVDYIYDSDASEGLELNGGPMSEIKLPLVPTVYKAGAGYALWEPLDVEFDSISQQNVCTRGKVTLHDATIESEGLRVDAAINLPSKNRVELVVEGENTVSHTNKPAINGVETKLSVTGTGTLNLSGGQGMDIQMSLLADKTAAPSVADTVKLNGVVYHDILDTTLFFTVYGETKAAKDWVMSAANYPYSFTVDKNATLTVPEGVTLNLGKASSIDNNGAIVNNGTLTLPSTTDVAGIQALTLTGTGTVQVGETTYDNNGTVVLIASNGLNLAEKTPKVTTTYKAGDGTVTWVPVVAEHGTHVTGGKLTLNNAVIENTTLPVSGGLGSKHCGIGLPGGDIEIEVLGGNKITSKEFCAIGYYSSTKITMTGDGSLTVDGSGQRGIDTRTFTKDEGVTLNGIVTTKDQTNEKRTFTFYGQVTTYANVTTGNSTYISDTVVVAPGATVIVPKRSRLYMGYVTSLDVQTDGSFVNNGTLDFGDDTTKWTLEKISELPITGPGTVTLAGMIYNKVGDVWMQDITYTGLDYRNSEKVPSVTTTYKAGEGTVVFTPKNETTPATLTLTNATVFGGHAALRLGSGNYTVTLVGENDVQGGPGSPTIEVTTGNLTIDGDGTLRTTFLYTDNGDIIIGGSAKVDVRSDYEAILAHGSITIRDSAKVDADSRRGAAIWVTKNLAISGGSVTVGGIGGFTAAAISGSAVVKVDSLTSAEATLTIGGQARLDASEPIEVKSFAKEDSAVVHAIVKQCGSEPSYTVYGNVVLAEDVRAYDAPFTVPQGASLTVPTGVTLNLAECTGISNKGTMTVDGTLMLPAGNDSTSIVALKLSGGGLVRVDNQFYFTDGTQPHTSTTALDFSKPAAEGGWKADATLADDGYTWKDNILTLENLNLTVSDEQPRAITLPESNVKLVLEGVNTVVGGKYDKDHKIPGAGIYQPGGSLTVSGTGTLRAGGKESGGYAIRFPIESTGTLVVESGTILSATMYGAAIFANTVTIKGGTIELDDESGMSAEETLTIKGGSVTVGSDEVASLAALTITITGGVVKTGVGYQGSIMAMGGDLTITGGTVVANWKNDPYTGFGIYAMGGSITISGGSVTANGSAAGIAALGGTITDTGMTAVTTPAGGTVKSATVDIYGQSMPFTTYTTEAEPTLTFVEGDPSSNGCKTVSLTKTPSGGGSSGGSSSGGNTTKDEVTHPDGSTTTTVTDKNTGATTETTKRPDGSTTVTETKKDGSVTTTDKAANGVDTITKTDKKGNTTATVDVPASVKDDVPVNIPADLGKTDGEVTVTVTYPDGKKETVTGRYENGKVHVTVSGSATIEILDDFVPLAAMPTFADVDEKVWYYDAVKYACEHGLFAGTSDTTFSPNAPMTRAMLWTVLGRLDGQTLSGSGVFAAAKTWAAEKGITDGSNPNGSITRAQLVTILWRYAGAPKANGDLSAFTDSGSVADYAKEAMAWAVENGIVGGSGGKLMPTGNATRAQVAAILMRYCQNVAK